MDTLFNVNQAAFILKVHPLTVRRYIREEKLTAVKVGGNVRIKEADLQNFTKAFTVTHKQTGNVTEKQSLAPKVFSVEETLLREAGRGVTLIQR